MNSPALVYSSNEKPIFPGYVTVSSVAVCRQPCLAQLFADRPAPLTIGESISHTENFPSVPADQIKVGIESLWQPNWSAS